VVGRLPNRYRDAARCDCSDQLTSDDAYRQDDRLDAKALTSGYRGFHRAPCLTLECAPRLILESWLIAAVPSPPQPALRPDAANAGLLDGRSSRLRSRPC